MVDKDPERLKPATDLLVNSANQVASDRARRINSLHNQVNGLLQDESKKRRQVGSEVGSIVQQQERLRKQLALERDEIGADVASGYGKVVNNLGSTIKQLSIGMKNISVSTARASADAVSQYGKAISQDISINKTNTVAMALSRATPIFGYFAAKFMETDVFRGAISKIRQGVGGAMLAGLRGAGSSISNIFRGKSTGEKIATRERELGALSSEVSSLKKELQAKPPKLQSGGYVKKGGVVEVHAAEIVAPVDTLVQQIVETTNKQQKGFLKTFIKEFKMARNPKEEAWQDRMLKSILELKVAFIGTTSRLRVAWQRTLLENPAFRGMLMFAEGFKLVLGAPINWFFGARGGYLSDVKKATATDNVFLKVANVLGLIYTVGMPKLDAIAKYTRVSATVAAGYEPKPPFQDKYTMFQKVKGWLAGGKKKKGEPGLKEIGSTWLWEILGVQEEELKEFKKEGGFPAMLGLGKEAAQKGFEGASELGTKGKEAAEDAFDVIKEQTKGIWELVRLKRSQEDRERPKSPSWVQYIGMTFGKAKETAKENIKQTKSAAESYIESKKTRKASEAQLSFLGRMTKRLKKLGSWGWKILLFAFNMIQGMINVGVSAIGQLLSPILSLLGIRGLFRGGKGGKGFMQTAGDLGKSGKKKAGTFGSFAKKTGRTQRRFGTKTALKFAGKRTAATMLGTGARVAGAGARVAGGLAGAALGGVMGVGMGLWDMVGAMRDPEGFAGGILARGLAGFLGGKDAGASGALSGAMKLGGIGAMVGSVVPGVGTLIGGAIGAMAGAILGFIGGKNISKAFGAIKKGIVKAVKGIWAVVTFMPKMLMESAKFVWKFFTETKIGKSITKRAKAAAKRALDVVTLPYRLGFKIAGKIKDIIVEKWKAFGGTKVGKAIGFAFEQSIKPIKELWGMLKSFGEATAAMWTGTIQYINKIIRKIKDTPIIGKFMKGIKEIHEGTWAEHRISEIQNLEGGKSLPKELGPKGDVTGILDGPVNQQVSGRRFSQAQLKAMNEAMGKKMDETGDKTGKVIVASSTNISNTIANTTNTYMSGGRGGGGGMNDPWGSGFGAAVDVTHSNLN